MLFPERRSRGAIALASTLLALILVACSEPVAETAVIAEPPADTELIRLDPVGIQEAGLALVVVESAVLPQVIEVSGRITVNETATARVGSFAEGLVVDSRAPVGTFVKKGQILARLHSHEVHDAEADYRRAQEELQRRRAELDYAQQAYRRASRLLELKAGALQQVQEAETKLRGAETSAAIAEAELRRAEAHLEYLGIQPSALGHPEEDVSPESGGTPSQADLLDIRSPISGTVIERSVSQGAVVTPSDPLYVISDLSRLWVIAQVPEQHLASLREGMGVDVSVRAYGGRPFPARISKIGDTLDPETRTVQVRCELSNPRRALKSEMYATLTIPVGAPEPSLAIPLEALQVVDDQQVVFVPEGENSFRLRRVETGRQSDSKVEVLSGLALGERVVVHGSFLLKSEFLKGQMMEEE